MLAPVCFLALFLCLAIPTSAITEDEQEEIIRAHNFYRAKAQPTPTNMVALVSEGEFCALE